MLVRKILMQSGHTSAPRLKPEKIQLIARGAPMTIRLHRGDLPDLSRYRGPVAIDTETMGLDLRRDRLCVVQLSPGDGSPAVVESPPGTGDAPNLKRLLGDPAILKIFHFARFDIAMLF